MLSFLLQVSLQLAVYLFCSLVHIFFYYIIYVFAVTSVKSVYKLITQVYLNGPFKESAPSDRAILITGATSGIGLALSKYFNAQGYPIIAGYYTDQEAGYGELVQLNQDKGGKSIFLVHVDVRSQESIKESYEKVSEILKENQLKLHALVNNAGIAQAYPGQWARRRDIIATAETNFTGPMLMARQYMPLLIEAPGSRIVNVSSILGRIAGPNNAAYCATKAGLAMFGNALAFDINDHNVRVVTIFVGHAIHHTGIVNKITSLLNVTYEEFSPEERTLYEQKFQRYKKGLEAFERSVQAAQNGSAAKKTDSRANSPSSIMRRLVIKGLKTSLGMVSRRTRLEDSQFMDSFDNAISMRNPPAELFSGNRFYTIVTSSFFDTIGHDVVRLLSSIGSSVQVRETV